MVLRGHIIYTSTPEAYTVHENSYIIIEDNKVKGIYKALPEAYSTEEVIDYEDRLIVPSFIDLHVHAPQYSQRGIGLHLQLINWLNQYTFELESKFADLSYAKEVYPAFVQSLYDHGSLRSSIFGTIHDESNLYLSELIMKKGMSAFVGKVNMDRHAPDTLTESAQQSLEGTKAFIGALEKETLVKPIITPRFAPSCSDELMTSLGQLSIEKHVPVQSHLSENKDEIKWVKALFPLAKDYTDVYEMFNLLGKEKTLMAHGIYLDEDELARINKPQNFLVHCPISNMNIASGVMPVAKYMDMGIQVGLGSDVAGGHEMGMNKSIVAAIQCGNILYSQEKSHRRLLESEVVYIATKLNGRFFGEDVGSLEPGFIFDALVIEDKDSLSKGLSPIERYQKFLYGGEPSHIIARYLEGNAI